MIALEVLQIFLTNIWTFFGSEHTDWQVVELRPMFGSTMTMEAAHERTKANGNTVRREKRAE